MVEHVVMWRLKEENRDKNRSRMLELLHSLKENVDVVCELRVGTDFNRSSAAFDVCLIVTLDTPGDIEVYQKHPYHQMVGEFVKDIVTERAIVDFEY
ncbi:MAG: hypothetical protein A2Y33_02795 [Spirochaetes bacterium GWF1_51_8]|nr:MAG: hypothetical protein A2Y33_02795 [Spirochaetes bacterium GWF1_51_8]